MLKTPDLLLVEKFVNLLMISGKKNTAHKIFCSAGCQFLNSIEKKKESHVTTGPEESCSFPPRQLSSSPDNAFRVSPRAGMESSSSENAGASPWRLASKTAHAPVAAVAPVFQNYRLLFYLNSAIENVQPSLECKRVRVAGASYQVPAIIDKKRGSTLAIRWIVEYARKRRKNTQRPFPSCLAQELHDAYKKQGQPRQRRDQYHKLSEANRGYLRYRWW